MIPQTSRDEICNILGAYAIAIDRQDWTLLRSCFTADATLAYSGVGDFAGYDSYEEMARRVLATCDRTHHLVGSIHVRFEADDAASSECLVQAVHRMKSGETLTTGGRYDDEFRCVQGRWLIRRRRFERIWGTGPTGAHA